MVRELKRTAQTLHKIASILQFSSPKVKNDIGTLLKLVSDIKRWKKVDLNKFKEVTETIMNELHSIKEVANIYQNDKAEEFEAITHYCLQTHLFSIFPTEFKEARQKFEEIMTYLREQYADEVQTIQILQKKKVNLKVMLNLDQIAEAEVRDAKLIDYLDKQGKSVVDQLIASFQYLIAKKGQISHEEFRTIFVQIKNYLTIARQQLVSIVRIEKEIDLQNATVVKAIKEIENVKDADLRNLLRSLIHNYTSVFQQEFRSINRYRRKFEDWAEQKKSMAKLEIPKAYHSGRSAEKEKEFLQILQNLKVDPSISSFVASKCEEFEDSYFERELQIIAKNIDILKPFFNDATWPRFIKLYKLTTGILSDKSETEFLNSKKIIDSAPIEYFKKSINYILGPNWGQIEYVLDAFIQYGKSDIFDKQILPIDPYYFVNSFIKMLNSDEWPKVLAVISMNSKSTCHYYLYHAQDMTWLHGLPNKNEIFAEVTSSIAEKEMTKLFTPNAWESYTKFSNKNNWKVLLNIMLNTPQSVKDPYIFHKCVIPALAGLMNTTNLNLINQILDGQKDWNLEMFELLLKFKNKFNQHTYPYIIDLIEWINESGYKSDREKLEIGYLGVFMNKDDLPFVKQYIQVHPKAGLLDYADLADLKPFLNAETWPVLLKLFKEGAYYKDSYMRWVKTFASPKYRTEFAVIIEQLIQLTHDIPDPMRVLNIKEPFVKAIKKWVPANKLNEVIRNITAIATKFRLDGSIAGMDHVLSGSARIWKLLSLENYQELLTKMGNLTSSINKDILHFLVFEKNNFLQFIVLHNLTDEFKKFFKKQIGGSKKKLQQFRELEKYVGNEKYDGIIAYFARYKQKTLLSLSTKLAVLELLGVKVNQDFFSSISTPLTQRSQSEIKKLIHKDGNKVSQLDRLMNFLVKATKNNSGLQAFQRLQDDLPAAMEGKIDVYNKKIEEMSKIFAEKIFLYFDLATSKNIRSGFMDDFGLEKIDDRLIDYDFNEAYKMFQATEINKELARELLKQYLQKKTYPFVSNPQIAFPQTLKKNMIWLNSHLDQKQRNIWFSRNEKTIPVTQDMIDPSNPEKITDHLNIGNNKLTMLRIPWSLTLDNLEDAKKHKPKNMNEDETRLWKDFIFQVNSIKQLQTSPGKGIKLKKIVVYRELNPMRVLMMGNWVNGSCLSFYSDVKNYWSAFTNAVDANKAVFYVENGEGGLLARVLVGITLNGKIVRFPTYYSVSGLSLTKAFNDYLKELGQKMGMGFEDKLPATIVGENWYVDPMTSIDATIEEKRANPDDHWDWF